MKFRDYVREGKQDFWKKVEGTEYLFREVGPGHYEVSAWTRGDTPSEIYHCYDRGKNRWSCSCPARGVCKHIKMVKKWLKSPRTDVPSSQDWKEMRKHMKKLGIGK